MTINLDQLLAAGAVVRVGGADVWNATRRLLGVGVRIGIAQQSTNSLPCPCHALNLHPAADEETR